MRIILWGIVVVALALWMAFVVTLSAPPDRGPYVWTVAPASGAVLLTVSK